jgi:hypothetical protein
LEKRGLNKKEVGKHDSYELKDFFCMSNFPEGKNMTLEEYSNLENPLLLDRTYNKSSWKYSGSGI